MPHGLDHIVHAVRDLDAAAEFYGLAREVMVDANMDLRFQLLDA